MLKRVTKATNFISLLVITFFFALTAQAQGQQGKQQGPPPLPDAEQIEEMIDDVSTTLSLSEDQKEQVSALYIAHFEKATELTKDSSLKGDDQRTAMDKLKEDFEEEVNAVLTKEQQKLFAAYQKKNGQPQGGQQKR
jgi:hypothetical protein